MATYWVDPDDGDNANAGTSPGAAWATIAYAMRASGIDVSVANDIILKPSIYKETAFPGWVEPTARQTVRADKFHAEAWTTRPQAGLTKAIWTSFDTDFLTAGSGGSCLSGGASGDLSYVTLRDIYFAHYGVGNTACIYETTGDASINTILEDCVFDLSGSNSGVGVRWYFHGTGGVTNLRISRCVFKGGKNNLWLIVNGNETAERDQGVLVESCNFGDTIDENVYIQTTGSFSFYDGGYDFFGNLFRQATYTEMGIGCSASIPASAITAKQNIFLGARGGGLRAATLGQIISDENVFSVLTNRTNVTAGASDVDLCAPLLALGLGDAMARLPFYAPLPDSPLVGKMSSTLLTTEDILNRPRPGGGSVLATPGAYEGVADIARETTTVPSGMSNALKMTGPGVLSYKTIPVDAVETTLTVEVRRESSTYTLGTRPSILLRNGAACEVADAKSTGTASCDDAFEAISFTFTPTSKGQVDLIFQSETTAAAGVCWFGKYSAT